MWDGQNAWPENVGLKNAAQNCRTGKSGKSYVFKSKQCTSHV